MESARDHERGLPVLAELYVLHKYVVPLKGVFIEFRNVLTMAVEIGDIGIRTRVYLIQGSFPVYESHVTGGIERSLVIDVVFIIPSRKRDIEYVLKYREVFGKFGEFSLFIIPI